MRRLALLLLVLAGSVWLGIKIQQSPGYVMFTYGTWVIETTLWVAIAALALSFIGFYFLVKLVVGATHIPGRFRDWSRRRKHLKASIKTNQGLCALAEGEWSQAEKELLQGAKHNKPPLINYLAAAKAAQEQGAYKRRDEYLQLASKYSNDESLAVGLTQAKLQINSGQIVEALATLKQLHEKEPHQIQILKLLMKVNVQLNDWESIQRLLPLLRKAKVLKPAKLHNLEVKVYRHLLSAARTSNKANALAILWQKIPGKLQDEPDLLVIYADNLLSKNQADEAEHLIKKALKKHWDAELVRLYGRVKSQHPAKQLQAAESWLTEHKNDPNLLLTLGRLCIHNSLWGKARSYLENSIKLDPKPETYAELGTALQQLGEREQAMMCYQKGAVE